MMYIAVLVLVAACNAAPATDVVSAFDHHVNRETDRLWVQFDFNQNGAYDLDDAHTFIHKYDSNSNGEVDRQEFDFHWGIDEPTMMIVGHGLFLEYDDDQSGVITASDIDAMYGRMDQDNNGTVDKKEFKQYYHQLLTVLFILQTQHLETSNITA